MENIETRDGLSVHLEYDDDASSPTDNSDDDEREAVFVVTTSNRYFEQRDRDRRHTPEDVSDGYWKKTHWAFPLYMYAHGGVALSLGTGGQFSDPWDSGQVGFVLVSKTAESSWRLSKNARKAAECCVEEWNQYLSGDVWGYIVRNEDGETVDSCWGFYGREYAESEARSALTHALRARHDDEEQAQRYMAQ